MIICLTETARLNLVHMGLSKTEIAVCEKALIQDCQQSMADSLFVTPSTIKFHLTNIFKKVDVKGMHGLLLYLFPQCELVYVVHRQKITIPIIKEEIELPKGSEW